MRSRLRASGIRATLVLLAGVWLAAAPVRAASTGSATEVFSRANDLYAAGKFQEASQRYLELIDAGVSSAALHYNLGNAFFKTGRLGPAILHYEKALALAPADSDIRENLEFARRQTADKTSEGGARTTAFIAERLLALWSMDQAAVLFVGFYLLTCVLAAVYIAISSRNLRRVIAWGITVSALPLLVTGGFFAAKAIRAQTRVEGVVVEARIDVRSGPDEDNTTLFTVHEGLKVQIRGRSGTWSQVSLENGLSGWIPSSSVGVI